MSNSDFREFGNILWRNGFIRQVREGFSSIVCQIFGIFDYFSNFATAYVETTIFTSNEAT